MEKEKLESLLIDYLDGRLTPAERLIVEQELAENPGARKLHDELAEIVGVIERLPNLDPDPGGKERFKDALQQEMLTSTKDRTIYLTPSFYRVAAAVALLILGGGIGFWISNERQDRLADIEDEMARTKAEIAETAETRAMMLGMLENEQSASQRIRGVNVAMQMTDTDTQIVDALFNTMLSDPNTNVRMAALDALARFRHDPLVRKGLINALATQDDPIVQISLIQLMVDMKEKDVLKDLQRIVDDEGTMKAVKDEAYTGILKLS